MLCNGRRHRSMIQMRLRKIFNLFCSKKILFFLKKKCQGVESAVCPDGRTVTFDFQFNILHRSINLSNISIMNPVVPIATGALQLISYCRISSWRFLQMFIHKTGLPARRLWRIGARLVAACAARSRRSIVDLLKKNTWLKKREENCIDHFLFWPREWNSQLIPFLITRFQLISTSSAC